MGTTGKGINFLLNSGAGLQEMILMGEIVLQSKIAQRAAERLRDTHTLYEVMPLIRRDCL